MVYAGVTAAGSFVCVFVREKAINKIILSRPYIFEYPTVLSTDISATFFKYNLLRL